MNELTLRLKSGASFVVPASLDAITTYVVLEQEDWLEKEIGFLLRWLRPGMTAIDIGANLGVYSLQLARRVGPHGHVFSYEPGSEARAMLERSRGMNQADNLHVIAAAVSDSPREGHLVLGASSELNSLEGSGPGEAVRVTCLDAEDGARGWAAVDFIKIDAEGEEERILAGGKSFFDRHSPLAMFEIKAGDAVNETLRSAFRHGGYNVYRLLPGAPVLVPDEPGKPIDAFELNLFAAKPDRAAALAREGLLLDWVPDWTPDATARDKALDMLRAQAFASAFPPVLASNAELDPDYRDGLAGYATWRSPEVPLAERYAALEFACGTLLGACEKAPTIARFSTLARAAWEAGQRTLCTAALRGFSESVMRGHMDVSEPFWPACARFDNIAPGAARAQWLLVSAFEQLERTAGFSSLFKDSEIDLDWLCAQPFVATEMERRRVLQRVRAGERLEVPARLCVAADDHINADVWRGGFVPGTWVRGAAEAG
jgi:FkbM family methyltransferase